jgi:hypothetical protein
MSASANVELRPPRSGSHLLQHKMLAGALGSCVRRLFPRLGLVSEDPLLCQRGPRSLTDLIGHGARECTLHHHKSLVQKMLALGPGQLAPHTLDRLDRRPTTMASVSWSTDGQEGGGDQMNTRVVLLVTDTFTPWHYGCTSGLGSSPVSSPL